MSKTVLLLIDPQNDFLDLPKERHASALPVAGAYADMLRVVAFLKGPGSTEVDEVVVTLDTHPEVAIERPAFWKRKDGAPVTPFSTVSAEQVEAGDYVPVDASLRQQVLQYLRQLESSGKRSHMIWPEHCVEGTPGAAILEELKEALQPWYAKGKVTEIRKGSNPLTEHYSAVKAEVPRDDDPATQANPVLIAKAREAGKLLVAGEAGSHCVASTVNDLIELAFNGSALPVVLLANAMSPVTGCEEVQAEFVTNVILRGGAARNLPR